MKRHIAVFALVCAGFAGGASNVSSQTTTVTDERVQELIRVAAARAGVSPGAPGASAQTGVQDARPMLPLTLDDAIKLALERNLDIAVQRLNPSTFDFSVRACWRTTAQRSRPTSATRR